MANTYTSLHYHIVFSTKERRPLISMEIEDRVWKYVGGIARENGMQPIRTGGVDDHLHVLLGARPTISVSKIVQLLKGGSSKWIHETFPKMGAFSWQDGYGAFSVSRTSPTSGSITRTNPFRTNSDPFYSDTESSTTNGTCGVSQQTLRSR